MGMNDEKNRGSKISCYCPFKQNIFQLQNYLAKSQQTFLFRGVSMKT
jgi:hypothetical protein